MRANLLARPEWPSLAVLVPTLNRPGNLRPLTHSFLNACPDDALLIFIANEHDEATIGAVRSLCRAHDRIRLLIGAADTWPKKINSAVAAIDARWYLFGADDIHFEEGWWSVTASFRETESVGYIGLNDGVNARVLAGFHSTHSLVRRDYARLGTIDGASGPAHEGYNHWYCDDELVATAKARGAWAMCLDARVPHHHPHFDQSVAWDQTYARADSRTDLDGAEWGGRRSLVYRAARPFPHMVIDGLIELDTVRAIHDECPPAGSAWQRVDRAAERVRRCENTAMFGVHTRALLERLTGAEFRGYLTALTGVRNLSEVTDVSYHVIERGGYVGVHANRTLTETSRGLLYRRLALILFLNHGWREEWRGHLELWRQPDPADDVTRRRSVGQSILPVGGNAVVFTTSPRSFSGSPLWVACPVGCERRSLAIDYLSPEPPEGDAGPSGTVSI